MADTLFRTVRARRGWTTVDGLAAAGLLFILLGLYMTFGWGPVVIGLGVVLLVVAWAWT